MKKILLSAFAIITFSLLAEAQVRIGAKAGGNISKQRVNVSHGNSIFSNDKYKSYHAGLISEFTISERFYLQPQLLYSRKGATLLSSTGAADTKVRISYLELPVNLVYKLPVSFGKVFGGAGAAFSYGFGGKLEQNGQRSKVYNSHAWKHEDVSLSFTAGVEFDNGLFASINSQKGLLDIYKGDGVSVKNRSVSVSLGYMIDWNLFKRKG
jgi:hypothetical protein